MRTNYQQLKKSMKKLFIGIGVAALLALLTLWMSHHHGEIAISASDNPLVNNRVVLKKVTQFLVANDDWQPYCVLYYQAHSKKRAFYEKRSLGVKNRCDHMMTIVFNKMQRAGIIKKGTLNDLKARSFWDAYDKLLTGRSYDTEN